MATPAIITQDILDRLNDRLSNYTTGSIDLGNRLRGINSAIEYIKRRMTLPSDEAIQRFYFTQDTMYYNLNTDFFEGLAVLYDDTTLNLPQNKWHYKPYLDILEMTGIQYPTKNYFSWNGINGQMQLIMYGQNLNQGQTLSTFDDLNAGGYVGENDATSLAIDTNIYKEGSGSLSFTIDPTKGNTGIASILFPTNFDFFQLYNNNGLFKLYTWLASVNISEVNLLLINEASTVTPANYYSLSATTFSDGTAFSTGLDVWKLLSFSFTNPTVVGSPNISTINSMRIDFVLNNFGNTAVPNFRVDKLYSVFPDYMDLIYLSSYKGTDTTGATKKIFLTQPSDIPMFANYVPDMLDIVANQAAVICAPQITGNAEFRAMYKQDQIELMEIFGKSWPRKRIINQGKTVLSR